MTAHELIAALSIYQPDTVLMIQVADGTFRPLEMLEVRRMAIGLGPQRSVSTIPVVVLQSEPAA